MSPYRWRWVIQVVQRLDCPICRQMLTVFSQNTFCNFPEPHSGLLLRVQQVSLVCQLPFDIVVSQKWVKIWMNYPLNSRKTFALPDIFLQYFHTRQLKKHLVCWVWDGNVLRDLRSQRSICAACVATHWQTLHVGPDLLSRCNTINPLLYPIGNWAGGPLRPSSTTPDSNHWPVILPDNKLVSFESGVSKTCGERLRDFSWFRMTPLQARCSVFLSPLWAARHDQDMMLVAKVVTSTPRWWMNESHAVCCMNYRLQGF